MRQLSPPSLPRGDVRRSFLTDDSRQEGASRNEFSTSFPVGWSKFAAPTVPVRKTIQAARVTSVRLTTSNRLMGENRCSGIPAAGETAPLEDSLRHQCPQDRQIPPSRLAVATGSQIEPVTPSPNPRSAWSPATPVRKGPRLCPRPSTASVARDHNRRRSPAHSGLAPLPSHRAQEVISGAAHTSLPQSGEIPGRSPEFRS